MWNEFFTDQVVVVAGGAAGIGGAAVIVFARAGAITVILDYDDVAGQGLADQLTGEGYRAFFRHCDVSSETEVTGAFDWVETHCGPPDVVYANAGVEWTKDVRHTSLDEWNRVVAINLTGVFLVSRAALLSMCPRNKGAIVVTSSPHALATVPDAGAYAATKGGAHALVTARALEGAPFAVRVNGILPGTIDTPMVRREAEAARDPEAQLASMVLAHPLGRLGQPNDVAQVALFLASPLASFVTGAMYAVDGGLMAALPAGPAMTYNAE